MHSRTLLARLSAVLGFVMGVMAQDGPPQCLPGWEWNQNSLGQDPCTIAMMLDSHCRGDVSYPYPKLNQSEWYLPPNRSNIEDMTCDCDTVMYSLNMACSTCQGGISYGWGAWDQGCGAVLISQYSGDIPQGTAIPHWAFYNVTLLSKQQFDNFNAQAVGRDPEAKPTPPNVTGADRGDGSNKTAPIIGGVVGGVALIIAVAAVFFGFRWWQKNKEKKLQERWDYPGGYDARWKTPPHSPASATYSQSFSTGPTLVSNLPFQPYTQPSDRAITYVTPISGSDVGR